MQNGEHYELIYEPIRVKKEKQKRRKRIVS